MKTHGKTCIRFTRRSAIMGIVILVPITTFVASIMHEALPIVLGGNFALYVFLWTLAICIVGSVRNVETTNTPHIDPDSDPIARMVENQSDGWIIGIVAVLGAITAAIMILIT